MNAEVTPIRTHAEMALLAAFAARRGTLPGIAGERADAFRMFEQAGLPHRRVEEWKYTDLRTLMREAKPLAERPDRAAIAAAKNAGTLAGVDARRLVLLNGAYVPELSDVAALDPGLSITSLGEALLGPADALAGIGKIVPTNDIVVALNTAFMTDGLMIRVAKGTEVARPIHIVHVLSGPAAATFTRSRLVVEPGARVTLIESFDGPAGVDYQVSTALELVVGDGAHVDRVKVGTDGDKALHLSSLMAALGGNAVFNDFAFTIGGAVTRNQLFLRLDGEGTKLGVRGANLLNARQHADTTMVVDHVAGGCEGRQLFKSVLEGQSRVVFQGKIIVRESAQKTDARMASHALLLSDEAEADNKPELEIFADDVQCGHGATSGALDDDLLFYLKARGIPPKEAEALLIQAFVGEAIEGVAHDALRDALIARTEAWLKARG